MKFKLSRRTIEKTQLLSRLNESYKKINELLYRNPITNLPNRNKLIDLFNESTRPKENTEKAVIHIDIDRFHIINELYGRRIGNQLLKKVGERLQVLFGYENTVFHEGEDEFLILLEDIPFSQLEEMGQMIIDSMVQYFTIDSRRFYLTTSIGISHYPSAAPNIKELLRQAEISMYNVKNKGKDAFEIFVSEEVKHLARKRRIEFDLHEALNTGQFHLVYQPKLELDSGRIYSMEALLRWEHPELGNISPGEFIPIAEESGVIIDIGYWVNEEAIRQTKHWHDLGYELSTSVNVSVAQFSDRNFVSYLMSSLRTHELDPKYFIVEVTESIVQNINYAEIVLSELKRHNIRIAIDDFGTGYSSLSVLNNHYVDLVKIDKSFINNVPCQARPSTLVQSIIEMGKSLNLSIIAEGIETTEQAEFLEENDCQYGQGFLFSKPLLPKEILNFLSDENQHQIICPNDLA